MKFFAEIDHKNRIIPLYDSDYEKLKKVKKNTQVQIDIVQPRNIKFHKKFFALINMVFENQERFDNIEILRKELTIESGFYDEYIDFHGTVQRQAKSISFSNMDETEFSELYSKFINTVIRVTGWDSDDIDENLISFM